MGLKLDLVNVYDHMERDFLSTTLEAFGFHDALIKIVPECISSVSLLILLNESPFGLANPLRG